MMIHIIPTIKLKNKKFVAQKLVQIGKINLDDSVMFLLLLINITMPKNVKEHHKNIKNTLNYLTNKI